MQLAQFYVEAKAAVVDAGYAAELAWQESRSATEVTEQDVLAEGAWSILSVGLHHRTVESVFPSITEAFGGWRSAQLIVRAEASCRRTALEVFNHRGKVDAIVEMAKWVHGKGLLNVLTALSDEGPGCLQGLPYFGPASSAHLAKNLGYSVAKSDRHLTRLAQSLGFTSTDALCAAVSSFFGDEVGVVDIVFWRFATLQPRLSAHA